MKDIKQEQQKVDIKGNEFVNMLTGGIFRNKVLNVFEPLVIKNPFGANMAFEFSTKPNRKSWTVLSDN